MLLVICLVTPADAAAARLQPATVQAWESYIQLTEKRIAAELDNASGFLHADFMQPPETAKVRTVLRNGRIYSQKLRTTAPGGREIRVPDGMIHHWYVSTFVPNTNLQTVLNWMQDFEKHAERFNDVDRSRLLSRDGDTFNLFLRVSRKKIITVHYNTEHAVAYRTHSRERASSRNVATRIAEIDNAGTREEREKPVGDDSGYFWKLRSYWRYQEQDGGVIVECESVSLSRSIPFALGWLIKRFMESAPRESLEDTLLSIREGTSGKKAAL
jgi:hypothetical protein